MFDLWSQPEVCEYSGEATDLDGNSIALPARSASDSDKIIEFFSSHQDQGVAFRWAMILKQDHAFVGAVGFNSVGVTSELAYHLNSEYWRLGLISEACVAALSWLQSTHDPEIVEAYIEPSNMASLRLATGLGFEKSGAMVEGTQRYVFVPSDA